jgi:hypothetical protein
MSYYRGSRQLCRYELMHRLVISLMRGRATFGTSIFLIGIYRLGMSDSAFRTVNSRVKAIIPENTPYRLVVDVFGTYCSDINPNKNEDIEISTSTGGECNSLFD